MNADAKKKKTKKKPTGLEWQHHQRASGILVTHPTEPLHQRVNLKRLN